MLVPQTDAFNTLLKRLQAIPLLTISNSKKINKMNSPIDFQNLIEHFDKITFQRTENVRQHHRKTLEELAAFRQ